MLRPLSKFPTHAACLRRVCRVNKHNTKPSSLSLVSGEVLKLPESPTMQPCPDPLSGLDVGANVGQGFHADFSGTGTDSFGNDGSTGFVVDVLDMPLFAPGDSAELAFSSHATIGLETTTMGKVNVPVMPEFSAPPDLAGAGGREVVLAHVNAENAAAGNRGGVRYVEDEVEVPYALSGDQIRFLWHPAGKQVPLVLSTDERNLNAAVEREQRQRIILERVGAFVEVDRRWPKSDDRNRLILSDALVGLQGFVGVGDAVHGLAHHLTAKGGQKFAHRVIDQVMQGDTVPAAMLNSEWHDGVAGQSECVGKRGQCQRLFRPGNQLERYSSSYHIGNNMLNSEESQVQRHFGRPLPIHMPEGSGISRRF